jgi:hypothetical protein
MLLFVQIQTLPLSLHHAWNKEILDIKVILQFIMINYFGRELVVLHTRPSMFGKFLVHPCRQWGGLNEEYS